LRRNVSPVYAYSTLVSGVGTGSARYRSGSVSVGAVFYLKRQLCAHEKRFKKPFKSTIYGIAALKVGEK